MPRFAWLALLAVLWLQLVRSRALVAHMVKPSLFQFWFPAWFGLYAAALLRQHQQRCRARGWVCALHLFADAFVARARDPTICNAAVAAYVPLYLAPVTRLFAVTLCIVALPRFFWRAFTARLYQLYLAQLCRLCLWLDYFPL